MGSQGSKISQEIILKISRKIILTDRHPSLVHFLLPGLLLKEAPHDGDGGDDADDHCLGEDDPCSVLHILLKILSFGKGVWSTTTVHCSQFRSAIFNYTEVCKQRDVDKIA